jgi:hypothetical protein
VGRIPPSLVTALLGSDKKGLLRPVSLLIGFVSVCLLILVLHM